MLAAKLSRQGFAVSGGAVAMWMSEQAGASVPASLLTMVAGLVTGRIVPSPTITKLTQGVLKMMLVSKLKAVFAAVFVFGVLSAGVVVHAQTSAVPEVSADVAQIGRKETKADAELTDAEFIRKVTLEMRQTPPSDIEVHYFLQDKNPQKREWLVDMLRREAARGKVAAKAQVENDMANLEGEWQLVDVKKGTTSGHIKILAEFRLSFRGDRMTLHMTNRANEMRLWKLSVDKNPKLMLLSSLSEPHLPAKTWAYELIGDHLRIAAQADDRFPVDIFKRADSDVQIMELRRVTKPENASEEHPLNSDGTYHDLGRVKQGTQIKHVFRVANTSTGSLHLTSVRVSAGSMKALLTKEVLQPNEQAEGDD